MKGCSIKPDELINAINIIKMRTTKLSDSTTPMQELRDNTAIIEEQETYIKFLSDELKQKDRIIEAQDEYILYLREAIDRVYIHLKNPSRYYDSEFLLRGDMIRNKIERNKNDI